MNLIDIIIIVLLVAGLLQGFRWGLIVNVALLLALLASFAIARAVYPYLRDILKSIGLSHPWVVIGSYLLIVAVFWGLLAGIVRGIALRIRSFARLLLLGCFDRIAGAVLGLAEAALFAEMLLYLGKRAPNAQLRHAINHSKLAPTVLQLVPALHQLFPHVPRI